jgi:putative redox protein
MTGPHSENLRGATLTWRGEGLQFVGHTDAAGDGIPIPIDGETQAGASPMEILLLSLAGCMAIDIRMILERSRVSLETFSVRVEGVRKDDHPKAYRAIRLHLQLSGPTEADRGKVERAIQLSEEKYCSVHHSLDPATEIQTSFELS